jgi:hypothetical protein
MSFRPQQNTKEALHHCAYNHSRECFLALEIKIVELSSSVPLEKRRDFPPLSGSGLWVRPIRGQFITKPSAPVDLIFLDKDCRVLEMTESFSAGGVNLREQKVASMLVLPTNSIHPSQTQAGDRIVVCEANELEMRLEEYAMELDKISINGAALLREKPLWSDGPGVLQFENPASLSGSAIDSRHEMGLTKPDAEQFRAPKNWLERWWSPDPRKSARQPGSGLAAYYWDGGPPKAHGIRDISKSGIYVVTEDRWSPGTLVLMSVRRTDGGETIKERSISVQTRAVRWGNDGVGLQFILPKNGKVINSEGQPALVATAREVDEFLRQLAQRE